MLENHTMSKKIIAVTVRTLLCMMLAGIPVLSGCSEETALSVTSGNMTEETKDIREQKENTEDETKVSQEKRKNNVKDTEEASKEEATSRSEEKDETKETDLPETEKLTEDPNITEGLSAFFKNKLTVDPKKTTSYLNVRKEPSEDSDILSILYPNEVVTYLSKRGDWYEIQCDGYTAYVNSEFVLTDSKAYEASRHNIGYAVMIKEFETVLYETPDEESQGIRLADKAEVYTLSGVIGEFYRLDVVSEYVNFLYVKQEDAVLFYQFLGPNVTNGLDEGTEAYLDALELGDYALQIHQLTQEAEVEKVERENARIAYEEASKEAEESSIAESIAESLSIEEASILAEEASLAQVAEEQEAYRRSVEESRQQAEASRQAAEAQRKAAEEASRQAAASSSQAAAQGVKGSAQNAWNARRNFIASHGGMSAANVQRNGTYAVTLDQGVIDYTVNLCNQYGLDPAVVFSVMYHESHFHPTSLNSRTSATYTYGREGMSYGLMQVIPYWSKSRMASLNISYPDGLYDPYNNILVGILILVDHGAQSDWVNALANFSYGQNDSGYNYANSVLSLAQKFDNR